MGPDHAWALRHTRHMTDDNLTDALAVTIETARSAERDLFGGLGEAILERPIREDDWNPKDFQAHLTAWKARQADRFAAMREGRELPPPMEDPEEDALNAELAGGSDRLGLGRHRGGGRRGRRAADPGAPAI